MSIVEVIIKLHFEEVLIQLIHLMIYSRNNHFTIAINYALVCPHKGEVSVSQYQSVNKRYLICPKPTPERPLRNTFRRTYPSSVGFDYKITTFF